VAEETHFDARDIAKQGLSKESSKGASGSVGRAAEGSNGRSNVNAQQAAATATKRKLSYQEAREFANIEDSLVQAESELSATRAELADPQLASDGQRLLETCKRMEKLR